MTLFFVLCGLTACHEDNGNWTPGQSVSATCQQVRFSSDSPSSPEILSGDPSQISIGVCRNTKSGELTVPISVISADPELQIPEFVRFDDGVDSVSISIIGPDSLAEGHDYHFALQLEGEHTDPYSILNGTTKFYGTMRICIPVVIRCVLQIGTTYQYYNHKAYLRDHKIVLPNFFGSSVKVEVNYGDDGKVSMMGEGEPYEDGTPSWEEYVGDYGMMADINSYMFVDDSETYYTFDNCPYYATFLYSYSRNYPGQGYLYLCMYTYCMDEKAGYYYLYVYPEALKDEDVAKYPLF